MEKMSAAMSTLAAHPGRIKQRLAEAVKSAPYVSSDFSASVREQGEKAMKPLSQVSEEDAGAKGRFQASIDLLSEEEAQAVVEDFLTLYFMASQEYYETRGE